ncbi:MAG: winged helix DNA-binding domain-containing protein [Actinomycetota bacterium]
MKELTEDQVRSMRMRAQHLARSSRASSPEEVVRDLCGLQAQDLRASRTGVWARSSGLDDGGVERARVEDRSIVRTWAMRGTLHLLAAEDVGWIRALLAPRFIAAASPRSRQLGLDEPTYSRAMASFAPALEGGAALTRKDLLEGLRRDGIDGSGQRTPYLIGRASMEGLICEGPFRSGKPTYVLTSEWLGAAAGQPLKSEEEALSRLVNRFLKGYGPAAPEDLAAWSGLPVSIARRAFENESRSLTQVKLADRKLSSLGEPDDAPQDTAGVMLLPAFDTYLLGYRYRDLVLDSRYLKRVNAGGGIVKPVLMVAGRVAGTWALRRSKGAGKVEVSLFDELGQKALSGLEARTQDLGRFLDLELSLKLPS